jgi:RNA polymerase sigma factor for flagellar operon FliA
MDGDVMIRRPQVAEFSTAARTEADRDPAEVGRIKPKQAFLDHLDLIDRAVASICRRHSLPADDAEDLKAHVRMRLIDDDYAILRKFQGKSALGTFLTVVIANLFRDWRTARWGKWRPSAIARRHGSVGIRLEALISRDGYSIREAIHVLLSRSDEMPAMKELVRIAAELPPRSNPRKVERLVTLDVASLHRTDHRVLEEEWRTTRETFGHCLARALSQLTPEDQLILKLRFQDGMSVAAVARTLSLEQKPLYRRIDNCLARLRALMSADGMNREQISDFVGVDWPA